MKMNNSMVGIVVMFLAITVTFPLVVGQPPSIFYKLSLQWPNSACKSQICLSTPTLQYFSIHGLWPHDAKTGLAVPPYFQNRGCTNVPQSQIVYPYALVKGWLTSIQADLNTYWPNLSGPNIDFWKHEWKEHGMCSGYGNQPLYYFNLALSLTKHINLGNMLQVQGIHPSNNQPYANSVQISNAIFQKLGVYPEIHCDTDYSSRARVIQLKEVRFCVDSRTRMFQNCTAKFTPRCGQPVGQIRFTAP